jgi:hypothetical protein
MKLKEDRCKYDPTFLCWSPAVLLDFALFAVCSVHILVSLHIENCRNRVEMR